MAKETTSVLTAVLHGSKAPTPQQLQRFTDFLTAKYHQHCILLVGYDEKQYYFNDPWMNAGCRGYDRKLVEQRYREMGMQVVTAERKK